MLPDDARIRSTMEAVHKELWCKTTVGGIARHETLRDRRKFSTPLERFGECLTRHDSFVDLDVLATVDGQTTAHYIADALAPTGVTLTSLAQGVPIGGELDYLNGDYLAELTMLILAKAQAKDPSGGYARTFLTQMEQVLGTCLDRGIKVVANAGGLNPAGLAAALRELSARLGLTARVAHVEGDDLRGDLHAITPPVGDIKPVSANAAQFKPADWG